MPLESVATAVLMPTTAPEASTSGPPELPGLIAASVWMRFEIRLPSSSVIVAALAGHDAAGDGERVGAERAADRDRRAGPTLRPSECPIGAVGRPVWSIFTIARSVRVSMP